MKTMGVKNEEKVGRRRMGVNAKRRPRRDTSVVAISSIVDDIDNQSDQHQQQLPQQEVLDQTSSTTATTVKRSSRYRGVSRSRKYNT